MCTRTCDRAVLRTPEFCDDCIDDAYHWDTFVDRNMTTIEAVPATEREYREFMESDGSSHDNRESHPQRA